MKLTIDQINEAHSKVKSGADFPRYVQDLKSIGVTHYDNFVSNGETIYYGVNDLKVTGEAKYLQIVVKEEASPDKLKKAISIHQQGQTDYPTFCQQAAEAGVEKWVTHMIEMTVTYLDRQGNTMITESIPNP